MKIRPTQVLGGLGLLGSLLWLSLNTFLSPEWGPPGDPDYLGYETINRLWSPAFAAILCGFVGLSQRYPHGGTRLGRVGHRLAITGLVAMVAGNIAEFWFFTKLPYEEINARSLAWIGVLLGMLGWTVGATLLGLAGLRQHNLPAWSSVVFLAALPVFLGIFFAQMYQEAWLVLGVLGFAAGALALAPRLTSAPAPAQA